MLWEYHSDTYLAADGNAKWQNRFKILKAYAQFDDNAKFDKADNFTEMRPLLSLLNERFLHYAFLEETLCVDKNMIPYYG